MADDTLKPRRPDPNFSLVRKARAGTILGDRNESRGHVPTPPSGVGLTRAPLNVPVHAPAPMPDRNRFDFEAPTPPAMDPDTYHALQTVRDEVLGIVTPILTLVENREIREAAEREKRAERRGKFVLALIGAIVTGTVTVLAALAHGCS